MVMTRPMRNHELFDREIDRFHFPFEKLDSPKKLANGIDDVSHIQIARSDFMQHGRKQEEVFPVHQGNLDVRISRQGFLELQGCVQTTKSTAYDDDALWFSSAHWISLRKSVAPFSKKGDEIDVR